MKWKDKLLKRVEQSMRNNQQWSSIFENEIKNGIANVHLAIFNEPFLSLMFSRRKTIESRFSINKVAPFNQIEAGDIVLVKRSGGNIEAAFIAKNVRFFRNLTENKIRNLEAEFGKQIGWDVDPEFITNKGGAKHLTLMDIYSLTKIDPIETEKRDKTGWSIVKLGLRNTLFEH